MPNPIAYDVDFIGPLEGFERGRAAGDAMVKARLANEYSELTNEALGISNESLADRQQAALEATRAGTQSTLASTKGIKIENLSAAERDELELERIRLENEALRRANEAAAAVEAAETEEEARIAALYDKIADGTATAQDYQILAALLPEEQSKAVRESLEEMTRQQQEVALAEMAPIFAAFHSGSPGIGMDLLRSQAEAYRNAGEDQEADLFDSLVSVAESGADGATSVQAYLGYMMTELPGGTDIIEGVKTYWEIEKLRAELEALKNPETDELSTKDIFSMEAQLRGEFVRQTDALKLAALDYEKAVSSAAMGTGAGDVALVFGFMRMLDPGSVVRESEFAQARNTAGLWESLKVEYEKLRAGESLSPTQRASFLQLSREYLNAAQNDADKARDSISKVVTNYGLTPENIFGNTEEEEALARVDRAAYNHLLSMRRWIMKNNPEDSGIASMSLAEMEVKYPRGYGAYPGASESVDPSVIENIIDVDW